MNINTLIMDAIIHDYEVYTEYENACKDKYKEIWNLHIMLSAECIPHKIGFMPDTAGFFITYGYKDNVICSVIEHDHSYGHEEDLLEIKGLLTEEESETDSVVAHLTAEQVFQRIKDHYESVDIIAEITAAITELPDAEGINIEDIKNAIETLRAAATFTKMRMNVEFDGERDVVDGCASFMEMTRKLERIIDSM